MFLKAAILFVLLAPPRLVRRIVGESVVAYEYSKADVHTAQYTAIMCEEFGHGGRDRKKGTKTARIERPMGRSAEAGGTRADAPRLQEISPADSSLRSEHIPDGWIELTPKGPIGGE
jgi:hypothetical protein